MTTRTSWFLIASGPSLKSADVNAIRGQKVIAINDNYLLAPWADVLYACDGRWWDWHHERSELKDFRGRKITQDRDAAERYGIEYIESRDAPGLSRDPAYIHSGSNAGIQAINLACHFGARRIVLLGYDMQATDGKAHWFGEHAWHDQDKVRDHWHKWLWRYQLVAEDARRMDIEIINATRETALTCFPRQPLSSLLPAPA